MVLAWGLSWVAVISVRATLPEVLIELGGVSSKKAHAHGWQLVLAVSWGGSVLFPVASSAG